MTIAVTTDQGNSEHYDDNFHEQLNSRQVDVMQPKLTKEEEG